VGQGDRQPLTELLDLGPLARGAREERRITCRSRASTSATAASASREALLARSDLADSLRRAALVARGQEPLNGAAHG
jgi:hypothetical protein